MTSDVAAPSLARSTAALPNVSRPSFANFPHSHLRWRGRRNRRLQLSGGWCGGGCWAAGYPPVPSRRPLQACPKNSPPVTIAEVTALAVKRRRCAGVIEQDEPPTPTGSNSSFSQRGVMGFCWEPALRTAHARVHLDSLSAGGRQETAWQRPPPTARFAFGRWILEPRTPARRCSIRSPTAHSCSTYLALLAHASTASTTGQGFASHSAALDFGNLLLIRLLALSGSLVCSPNALFLFLFCGLSPILHVQAYDFYLRLVWDDAQHASGALSCILDGLEQCEVTAAAVVACRRAGIRSK